jgi:tetratricopeptide (TPR) repeat protein
MIRAYLRKPFLPIIGIIFVAAAAPAQSQSGANAEVMAYIQEGREFFLRHYYKQAVAPYEKALNLERKRPTLDKIWWRLLVDNLGTSYGISGDLKKAKETYAYGLAKDPKYWLFNYNMACTYAEMNDVDNTIAYLKKAYKCIEEMTTDKPADPDPWTDPSFQKLINDDKFLNFLTELRKTTH